MSLLADPARLAVLGSAAATHARSRHGWGRIASETEPLYRLVLTGADTPASTAPGRPTMSREQFAAPRTAQARVEDVAGAQTELWGRHLAEVFDGGGRYRPGGWAAC